MEINKEIIPISNVLALFSHAAYNDDIAVFETNLTYIDPAVYPLQFDFLFIILVSKGSCDITIDLREFHAEKHSLIVLQPNNYISLTPGSEGCSLQVLACSRYIVEEVLPVLTDILPLLLHNHVEPVRKLSESDARGIRHFYHFLKEKLNRKPTQFMRQKIICILQAALFEMLDMHLNDIRERTVPKTRRDEIMAKFIVAVSENFRTTRRVDFYADKLCITPKHLSAVVKEISGKTAGDWIENYVVMEAKVLLKTTDLTIQEISGNLNFPNQSFFGKYFKNIVGMSPTLYRRYCRAGKNADAINTDEVNEDFADSNA